MFIYLILQLRDGRVKSVTAKTAGDLQKVVVSPGDNGIQSSICSPTCSQHYEPIVESFRGCSST